MNTYAAFGNPGWTENLDSDEPQADSALLPYSGEPCDPVSKLRYLRAGGHGPCPTVGKFINYDIDEGQATDPASLQKYLYANEAPIDGIDPGDPLPPACQGA